jgi:hypothetical protein
MSTLRGHDHINLFHAREGSRFCNPRIGPTGRLYQILATRPVTGVAPTPGFWSHRDLFVQSFVSVVATISVNRSTSTSSIGMFSCRFQGISITLPRMGCD